MTTNPDRYSPLSMALHWLTAAAILCAIPLGLSLAHAPEAWGDTLYRLHWSFGLTALAIVVLRIANRLATTPPAPAATLTRLESVLSNVVHKALYVLMFLVPIAGWSGKSAYGGDIAVFGLFTMPALLAQDEQLALKILAVHGILAKMLIVCIALHVAGALNHALIKRDGILDRMLPRR